MDGSTWAEVCAATGATPHALMQWEWISGGWTGNPSGAELLRRLLDVLARFTTGDCLMAV